MFLQSSCDWCRSSNYCTQHFGLFIGNCIWIDLECLQLSTEYFTRSIWTNPSIVCEHRIKLLVCLSSSPWYLRCFPRRPSNEVRSFWQRSFLLTHYSYMRIISLILEFEPVMAANTATIIRSIFLIRIQFAKPKLSG